MHIVQIRGHKDPTWMLLPYMVVDEEIDRIIATWPPHWRLGFKSILVDLVGTSIVSNTPTPLDTAKNSEVRGLKGSAGMKDVTHGAEQESQHDMDTEGLYAQGVDSPRGMK